MSEAGVPTVLLSPRQVASESTGVRRLLIGVALGFVTLFLVLPLATVFVEALSRGPVAYVSTFLDPDARAAIALTLTVAAIVVPLNAAFGIAAAWAIAKFDFGGKTFLTTLIDLPFSVSPVISVSEAFSKRATVRASAVAGDFLSALAMRPPGYQVQTGGNDKEWPRAVSTSGSECA